MASNLATVIETADSDGEDSEDEWGGNRPQPECGLDWCVPVGISQEHRPFLGRNRAETGKIRKRKSGVNLPQNAKKIENRIWTSLLLTQR